MKRKLTFLTLFMALCSMAFAQDHPTNPPPVDPPTKNPYGVYCFKNETPCPIKVCLNQITPLNTPPLNTFCISVLPGETSCIDLTQIMGVHYEQNQLLTYDLFVDGREILLSITPSMGEFSLGNLHVPPCPANLSDGYYINYNGYGTYTFVPFW